MVINRFETIQPLKTSRLMLRPLLRSDAPRLQEIGTTEVFKYVPQISTPFDAMAWVESKFESAIPEIGHVVIENLSGNVIGYCQVAHGVGDTDYFLDVGYWFGQDYWGKGYATEAVCAVLGYMRIKGWNRYQVFAMTAPVNKASNRVLEKCGFELLDPKPSFLKDDGMLAFEWRLPARGSAPVP